jgi:hypothetical protein
MKLRATVPIRLHSRPPLFDVLRESVMDPIQEWSDTHKCGVRTSFDTFKFYTEEEITLFLLRWA